MGNWAVGPSIADLVCSGTDLIDGVGLDWALGGEVVAIRLKIGMVEVGIGFS